MKKLILVPEDVYYGLLSASHSGNPFDSQIAEKSRTIGQMLTNKRLPSDTGQLLYNQELKRLKSLKSVKPEAAMERELNMETTDPPPPIPPPNVEIPPKNYEIPPHSNDENFADLDATQDSIKTLIPTPPNSPAKEEEEISLHTRVKQITKQIYDRRENLQIDVRGRIIRDNKTTVQGSNLETIVRYILDPSTYQRAPNGYSDFLRQARQHSDLLSILNIQSQSGNGVFKFRPSLWKRF